MAGRATLSVQKQKSPLQNCNGPGIDEGYNYWIRTLMALLFLAPGANNSSS